MRSKYYKKQYKSAYDSKLDWTCISLQDAPGGHKTFLLANPKYILYVRDNDMTKISRGEITVEELLYKKLNHSSKVCKFDKRTVYWFPKVSD